MVPTVSTFISCRPSWWLDDSTQTQACKTVGGISETHKVSTAEHSPPGLPQGHAYCGSLAHCIEKESHGPACDSLVNGDLRTNYAGGASPVGECIHEAAQ